MICTVYTFKSHVDVISNNIAKHGYSLKQKSPSSRIAEEAFSVACGGNQAATEISLPPKKRL